LPIRANDAVDWLSAVASAGAARSTLGLNLRALDYAAERSGCVPPSGAPAVRTTMAKLRAAARRRERRDVARVHQLTVRFTAAELERVTACAQAAGVSPRRWLQQRALRAG
jgi:hypothetical protein